MRVHLVHKTHLDLGFTDLATNVESLYLERFIPDALRLARKLRETEAPTQFCWTVPTYILYRYLEQGTPRQVAEVEDAVRSGDVSWLGLPFTMNLELATPELLRESLTYAAELDHRFGMQTVAAKVTDVPGITVAAVPTLAEAGIEVLYIGANGVDVQAAVPPVFRWVAPDGSDIIVLYTQGYGGTVTLDGLDDILVMEFTADNVGPPNEGDVLATYLKAVEKYPTAEIGRSTLNEFAKALRPHRERLPVVEQEIGDVWLFGVASDPLRVARYRELARTLGELELDEAARRAAARSLLMVTEHTWGLDTMIQLTDTANWSKRDFSAARSKPRWQRFEAAWAEQSAYVDDAVAALPSGARAVASKRLASVGTPALEDVPAGGSRSLSSERFRLSVDERGAIVELHDTVTGKSWASPDAPLGLFTYEVFDSCEYERFRTHGMNPAYSDLLWPHYTCFKRGLEALGQIAQSWQPELVEAGSTNDRLELRLRLPANASEDYGAPRDLAASIRASDTAGELNFDVSWRRKDAIRVPEAAWLSFYPPVERSTWRFEKLGMDVDPANVVANGGRLHSVERVHASHGAARFELVTLDAALASLGRRIMPPADPEADGLHMNLLNTVFGTNYSQWCDDDVCFRFRLGFGRVTDTTKSLAVSDRLSAA